jgi:hypothetical protein
MKKPTLEEAHAELVKGLEHISRAPADVGEELSALAVVGLFLADTLPPDKQHLARPFLRLYCRLQPRRGHSMTDEEVSVNANCLAAVELFVRSGDSLKRAIGEVSKATGGRVSDAYLATLRKNLRKRGSAYLRDQYDNLLVWSAQRRDDPAEAAQRFLRQAIRVLDLM